MEGLHEYSVQPTFYACIERLLKDKSLYNMCSYKRKYYESSRI